MKTMSGVKLFGVKVAWSKKFVVKGFWCTRFLESNSLVKKLSGIKLFGCKRLLQKKN